MAKIKKTIVTIKNDIESFNNRVGGPPPQKKVMMRQDNFSEVGDKYTWNEFTKSDGMYAVLDKSFTLYFYDENNNWKGTEENVSTGIISYKGQSGIDMISINKSYFKYDVPVQVTFTCEGMFAPAYPYKIKFISYNFLTGL